MTTRPAALGLVLVDSEPFGGNPLDASLVPSTLWLVHQRRQTLQIWADAPFIFCWSDSNDPPNFENQQGPPYPFATRPANTFLLVEFVPGMLLPSGQPVTGFRMGQLGAGGVWYCNEWRSFT